MLDKASVQFSHVKPGETRYRSEGLRDFFLYRDEGEKDDICSIGQTLAAQDLCAGLKQYMCTHYIQPGVGHYGVFSGRRWSANIYPVVREVIHVSH